MIVMKNFILPVILLLVGISQLFAQENTPAVATPSPQAMGSTFSASVPVNKYNGLGTVDIPLTSIQSGGTSKAIGLSYTTTGIKVNQLASSVGIGWQHNAGGVITRIVRGLPDDCKTFHHLHQECRDLSKVAEELEEYDIYIEKEEGECTAGDCYGCIYRGPLYCTFKTYEVYEDVGMLWMGEERYERLVGEGQLTFEDKVDISLGIVDTEPDMFSFNFHGYSGQFIFTADGGD